MPINPTPIKEREKNINLGDNRGSELKKEKITIDFLISDPIYQFTDIVMDDRLKNSIFDALSIFKYRDKLFDEWKLSKVIKRPENLCINFYGEPGTGKTMAAHAVAYELGLKILKVNYADIESKYVGETSKNLVKMFNEAQEKKAIILFDEADALLSKRVTDMSSATDVSVNQTRSVLLTLLDSYKGIVIFTTNFISNYDSAFMRRIPYHIKFELPNEEMRVELLKHYLIGTVPNNILITDVAKRFAGISGCDIANATLAAALKTARAHRDIMKQKDFEMSLDNIIKSKAQNKGKLVKVETKEVSEEYALEQLDKTGGIKL